MTIPLTLNSKIIFCKYFKKFVEMELKNFCENSEIHEACHNAHFP